MDDMPKIVYFFCAPRTDDLETFLTIKLSRIRVTGCSCC